MVDTPFILFELMVYALSIACLWRAYKQGPRRAVEFLMGGVYGIILELATMAQLQGYHYGRFMIMIGDAPLPIGMGWAVIIYSSMEFSDRLDLPEPIRPFADALLALNIDLAMDPIATRLGFWEWHVVSPDARWPDAWFGVPWGNFWGWFVVVSSFSLLLRMMRRWSGRKIIGWLYPVAALIGSVVILVALDALYTEILIQIGLRAAAPIALVAIGLAIVISQHPGMERGKPDAIIAAVPLGFHLYFTLAGALTGIFARDPDLIPVVVIMAVLGLLLQTWPAWAPSHSGGA